jgi:hypothetical protein
MSAGLSLRVTHRSSRYDAADTMPRGRLHADATTVPFQHMEYPSGLPSPRLTATYEIRTCCYSPSGYHGGAVRRISPSIVRSREHLISELLPCFARAQFTARSFAPDQCGCLLHGTERHTELRAPCLPARRSDRDLASARHSRMKVLICLSCSVANILRSSRLLNQAETPVVGEIRIEPTISAVPAAPPPPLPPAQLTPAAGTQPFRCRPHAPPPAPSQLNIARRPGRIVEMDCVAVPRHSPHRGATEPL